MFNPVRSPTISFLLRRLKGEADLRLCSCYGINRSKTSNGVNQKGVGVIEIIVAVAVIIFVLIGILQLETLFASKKDTLRSQTQAIHWAQEALEAIKVLRDDNWANISSLTLENDYYVTDSGGSWQITSIDPGLLGGVFTRKIQFLEVLRDSTTDNIAPSGILDPNSRQVQVEVSWQERGEEKTVIIETYITNWVSFLGSS